MTGAPAHGEPTPQGSVFVDPPPHRRRWLLTGLVAAVVLVGGVSVAVVRSGSDRTSPSSVPATGGPTTTPSAAPTTDPPVLDLAALDPAPHQVGTKTFSASDPGTVREPLRAPLVVEEQRSAPHRAWTVTAEQILAAAPRVQVRYDKPVIDQVSASDGVAVVTLRDDDGQGDHVPVEAGIDLATGRLLWSHEGPPGCTVVDDEVTFCTNEVYPGESPSRVQRVDTRTGEAGEIEEAEGFFGHDVVTLRPATTAGDTDVVVTSGDRLRWRTTIHDPALAGLRSVPTVLPGAPELLALPVPGACGKGDEAYIDAEHGVTHTYLLDRETGQVVGTVRGRAQERLGDVWRVQLPSCDENKPRYRYERLAPGTSSVEVFNDRARSQPQTTQPAADDVPADAYSLPAVDGTQPEPPTQVFWRKHQKGWVVPPAGPAWGPVTSPTMIQLVADETVAVEHGRVFEARDLGSGALRWRVRASRAAGVLAVDTERVMLGRLGDVYPHYQAVGRLTAYDLRTGAEAWSYATDGAVTKAGSRLFDVVGDSVSLLG